MSLSNEDRLKARTDALTLMINCLGDKTFDEEIFDINEASFKHIPKTTWRELENQGLTERCKAIVHQQCRLTGPGWYEAVVVTRQVDDPRFREQLTRLTGAMKDQVKGRQEDAYLYVEDLASKAGVPENFVINAIESRLIDRQFKIQGAEWEHQFKSIRIPLEFGLRPLDRG